MTEITVGTVKPCVKCGFVGRYANRSCKKCHYAKQKIWRLENLERARAIERNERNKAYHRDPAKAREISRRWKTNHPEAYAASKWKSRLAQHGITQEQYDNFLRTQDNACAICLRTGIQLVIDHCHESGIVRGLLCQRCNTGLGKLLDRSDVLRRAADYIDQINETRYPFAESC